MRISVILRNINDTPPKKNLISNFEELKNKLKSLRASLQSLKLKPFATDKITKLTETPQFSKINTLATVKKEALYKRILNVNSWYIKVIGLEEVKFFHDRVLHIEEQLLNTQGKRREVGRQLNEIRQRALDLQAQLQNINKHDQFDQYFKLMKQEGDLVKLEKSILSDFQEYDQTERELFTAFTNAIRDSYEKQRAQVEYTKYFSLVLGILASFLTFVYSTVKKYDLKTFIDDKLSKLNPIDAGIYHEVLNINKQVVQDLGNQRAYLASNKLLLEQMQTTNNMIMIEQTAYRTKLNEVIGEINSNFAQKPVSDEDIRAVMFIFGGLALFSFLLGKAC